MALLTEPGFSSGKREDLADLISLVDAKNTPLTSMAKKGSKPGNTLMRWQADTLPTPKTTGTVDGTDVSTYENYVKDGATTYRAELSNYVQIFRRSVRVSPLTTDVATVAGVRDELANNVSKGILGLKRDQEATFGSANGAQADAGGVTPYLTRGLHKWLEVAGGVNQDAVLPIPSAFQTPSGNRSTVGTANLTEAVVQNILTGMWNQTGQEKSYDVLCGSALKRAFTNLVSTVPASGGNSDTYPTVRTLNRESDTSTYAASVDVFKGDFGTLRLHPSHWLKFSAGAGNPYVGYVLDFKLLEIRYGGNVAQVMELPNAGGGEARLIEAVAALCVHNPLGLGVFDFAA